MEPITHYHIDTLVVKHKNNHILPYSFHLY